MTEDRLKEAALELFTIHGYEGTSIAQIVKKVEIRKSSFYAHFESKASLFLEVYKDAVHKESERMLKLEKELELEDPVDQLYHLYIQLHDPSTTNNEIHFLHRMLFYPPVELQKEMQSLFSSLESRSSEIIRRLIEQINGNHGDTETILAAFYALIDGLAVQAHLYEVDEYKNRIQATWEFFKKNLK
ncbi:TetR/AcrR family transcriptional regulator [Jeotgalibacillus sp. S-D1]|uniref:TetR/AcrR family transcriptional regulator n=1 Tax=Jeotgalibacillus sp. S-D1 TaxID=2552189 RepID=UPI00105AAA0C|nr:TetR/AcrR family transcriptional regulator [Jeotgalibacillus sp. S-D1]TDL30483.1 TetR/AcrR family transcriptional regulator [Jeotgalibacillus sp. S-D1]